MLAHALIYTRSTSSVAVKLRLRSVASVKMRIVYVLLVLLSITLGGWLGESATRGSELDKVIEELRTKIAQSQVGKDDSNIFVKKQPGVYPCEIRINLCCSYEKTLVRDAISVFDNNAFVTLWVTSILLEATRFHDAPQPSDEQLLNAVVAVSSYRDKNREEDGLLVFWPQTYNSSAGVWSCGPENLGKMDGTLSAIMEELHKIFDDLGLEKIWEELFSDLENIVVYGAAAFHIPADFDDTFVNIGMGALLASYSATNHSSLPFQTWMKYNENFTKAMAALKKYAYRPHSGNLDNGMVDTRTYFYIREYLHEMEAEKRQGAFVLTWALNLTEDNKTLDNYAMPFNTNNIDLTVSSNVVYGLTAAVLGGMGDPKQWFDEDVQMIYENTTDLLAWGIERNFSSRPDIALTYYPSVYNFYWFTARTLNLIQSYMASHHGSLPFPVLGTVKDRLLDVMKNTVSPKVVKMATPDQQNATVYFDDFMGNDDRDIRGKPVNHAQDRIFSTAMAVNILLYVWMEGNTLQPETPDAVKVTVEKASQWLLQNTLSGKYKPWNAVFSGSVKSDDDLPFWYPANVFQFLNGTEIPPNPSNSILTVIGVNGTIPKSVYTDMLKVKHYNRTTPIDFHGYNKNGSAWPFWTSEPWTYASSMLALTQYRVLKKSGQLN